MKHRIAVESNLSPIKEYLSKKGYIVDNVNISEQSANLDNTYDAYVVSGMNSNFLGMQDTQTKSIVINADGLSPDKVYNQLKTQFKNLKNAKNEPLS